MFWCVENKSFSDSEWIVLLSISLLGSLSVFLKVSTCILILIIAKFLNMKTVIKYVLVHHRLSIVKMNHPISYESVKNHEILTPKCIPAR